MVALVVKRRHKRHGYNPWVRKIPWRRNWQLTPVFLPGKFHRQRSLVGYSPWGHKELDMTEQARTRSSFFHQAHIPCVLIPESKADFPPKRHQIPTCLPGHHRRPQPLTSNTALVPPQPTTRGQRHLLVFSSDIPQALSLEPGTPH